MNLSLQKILYWAIIVAIVLGIGSWIMYRVKGVRELQLAYPNGKETLQAGKTYSIAWKAKNVSKVSILLIKGLVNKDVEWLAKDISGGEKKYDWQVFTWQAPSQDYQIAIFESPWQDGNKIDYSDESFTIVGPQFASCDALSIDKGWPYVPSDYPGLRMVFATENYWSGNLEGLAGADNNCQIEAETLGFKGTWKAFLGDDKILATERLKLDGIFVQARTAAVLPEGKTCHQLLGKDFDEFFKKLSDPVIINQVKVEENFLYDLSHIWLGRINADSKQECVGIFDVSSSDISRNYSFTTTCQNWTIGKGTVSGYPPLAGENPEFPKCYTPAGVRINAVGLAGLSSGLIGQVNKDQSLTYSAAKSCENSQKLLCVQQ